MIHKKQAKISEQSLRNRMVVYVNDHKNDFQQGIRFSEAEKEQTTKTPMTPDK